MSEKNNKNQLNIELSEEMAEGVYSNLAVISHSEAEFVLDFVRIVPNMPKAVVKSRVILSPQHAKRLLRALSDNIDKFEQHNGPIRDQSKENYIPMNFTPTAKA